MKAKPKRKQRRPPMPTYKRPTKRQYKRRRGGMFMSELPALHHIRNAVSMDLGEVTGTAHTETHWVFCFGGEA